MFTGISRNGRLIMGRLEHGDDLEEGLLRICSDTEIRCGEIRALGALSHVELCAYDQKRLQYGPPRKYFGSLEILSLLGNISEKSGDRALHLHATLARDTDNGIQVIGGHVLSAKVFACEFTIHTCDDLILRRGKDKDTGLTLWTEKIQFPASSPEDVPEAEEKASPPSPPQSPAKKSKKKKPPRKQGEKGERQSTEGGAASPKASWAKKEASSPKKGDVSWDEVLSATLEKPAPKKKVKAPDKPPVAIPPGEAKEEESPEELLEEEIAENWKDVEIVDPQPGDLVIHPRFGRCKVERLEDSEFLHVRMESGRSVRLNMEIINLQLSGYEGGQQIFETKIGKF